MRTYTALVKIFANGKITIPKEVREVLGLEDGEIIEVTVSKIPMEEAAQVSNESPHEAPVTA